jgi:O-antigen ligase
MIVIKHLSLWLVAFGVLFSDRWLNNNTPGLTQSFFIFPFLFLSLLNLKINWNEFPIKALFFYILVASLSFVAGGFQGGILLTTIAGTGLIFISLINNNFCEMVLNELMILVLVLTLFTAMAFYLGFWVFRKEMFDSTRQTFMENNENTVAQQLCIGLSFILFFTSYVKNKLLSYLLFFAALFFVNPIVSTISRTGILLMFITFALFAYAKIRNLGGIGPLLILMSIILIFLLLGGIDINRISFLAGFTSRLDETSEDIRFELWDLGIQLARDNFFTGVGFGNFTNQDWRNQISSNHSLGYGGFGSTHNTFLDLIHIGGIGLLLPYLAIIGWNIKKAVTLFRTKNKELNKIAALVLSNMIGVLLFSQTAQAATDKLTWFLFAISFIWIKQSEKVLI